MTDEDRVPDNVVSLQDAARSALARRKRARKTKANGITLCRRGLHRWQLDPKKQFDVREGRLVTVRRCSRCGATRTTLE